MTGVFLNKVDTKLLRGLDKMGSEQALWSKSCGPRKLIRYHGRQNTRTRIRSNYLTNHPMLTQDLGICSATVQHFTISHRLLQRDVMIRPKSLQETERNANLQKLHPPSQKSLTLQQ
jgi:hypothetical protein